MLWFFNVAPNATPETIFAPMLAVAAFLGLYASSTYATMSELLPTRLRSTGIAIAYNMPVAIFGGSAPLISTWLIQSTGNVSSPVYFYLLTAVISLTALLSLKKEDLSNSGAGAGAGGLEGDEEVARQLLRSGKI